MIVFAFVLFTVTYVVGEKEFPHDFVWGSSTAAYQIEGGWNEGGRGPSIWDHFSHIPGKVTDNENGDTATDHYHKWKEDVQLIKGLGAKAYRFSVSWSRIVPTGFVKDGINEEGLEFYSMLVDELLQHGIEPYVCLYHWDLPQGLHANESVHGWLDDSGTIVDEFVAYSDAVFGKLNDRVKHWFTFNEPWTFVWLGYGMGLDAPGMASRHGNGDTVHDPFKATHNILKSHAKAAELYRNKYLKQQLTAVFSIVLNCDYYYPASSSNKDKIAAERALIFQLGWFADPIYFGQYPEIMLKSAGTAMKPFTAEESALLRSSIISPKGKLLGLNHYTSNFAKSRRIYDGGWYFGGWDDFMDAHLTKQVDGKDIGARAESDWLFVVPQGIRDLLIWARDRYTTDDTQIRFMITENGVDCPGEAFITDPSEKLNDEFRINYLKEYIDQIHIAIEEYDVPVDGYFVWSLMDNFEWTRGYSHRFGIVHVDFEDVNRKRSPKASYYWYKRLVESNGGDSGLGGFNAQNFYGKSNHSVIHPHIDIVHVIVAAVFASGFLILLLLGFQRVYRDHSFRFEGMGISLGKEELPYAIKPKRVVIDE